MNAETLPVTDEPLMGGPVDTPTFLRVAPAPLTVGIDGLAELLGYTHSSIKSIRVRQPNRLPPACVPPGSRQPRWIVADVIAWLRAHREPACAAANEGESPVAPKSHAGRPSKAEQIAKRQLAAAAAGGAA